MSATMAIILDTRRMKKKTKKYPVKLRVTFDRTPQYYPTTFDLSEEDFKKLSAPRLGTELQQLREKLKKIETEASNAAKEVLPFSFKRFEGAYISGNPLFIQKPSRLLKSANLLSDSPIEANELPDSIKEKYSIFTEEHTIPGVISIIYKLLIKNLLLEERIGTADCYHQSYQSLKKFRGNIRFQDITVSYLHQYERWMLNQGKSKTTIGIYLRALRTIFNEAISLKIIKKDECYPFGRRLYRIPTGRNIKKALDLSDIQKIYGYQAVLESEQKAKDFWLFSYFGNGMNIKDIALLKYKYIQGDYLVFIRAKTERTTREDPKPITVYLTEDMRDIIARWGNPDCSPDNYIFPILMPDMTAQRQHEIIKLFIRFINDWMRGIAKTLGIERKVTTLAARHSFSTVLKRSGASTEFIQEALGHTDKKTTENYLDSFEDETKKHFAERLSAFKQLPLPEAS